MTTIPHDAAPATGGLFGRRSVWGAVIVLGGALLYALVVPLVYESVRTAGFAAGEPYTIESFLPSGSSISIVPAEGWSLDPESNDFLATLNKGAAMLQIVVPSEATRTPEETIQGTIDIYGQRTDTHWEVGSLQTFTTDAGDPAAWVIAHSVASAETSWVISDGALSVSLVATVPDTDWASFSDELDDMARSVRFVTGGGG